MKGRYTMEIQGVVYIYDDFYYRRIKMLKNRIRNMKDVIEICSKVKKQKALDDYVERIRIKKEILDSLYKEVKEKCKKRI